MTITIDLVEFIDDYKNGVVSEKRLHLFFNKIIGIGPIKKYMNTNRLLDNDDIKQEYWIGVLRGIMSVDVTKEDTIVSYIRKCGWSKAMDYIKSTYFKNVIKKCKCGHVQSIRYKECNKCGASMEVETFQRNVYYDEFNLSVDDQYDVVENNINLDIKFDRLYDIVPSQQMKDILDDLRDKDVYNADNYIKALAEKRNTSTVAVANKLRKIKRYAQEVLHG